jgi:hypothetical protein
MNSFENPDTNLGQQNQEAAEQERQESVETKKDIFIKEKLTLLIEADPDVTPESIEIARKNWDKIYAVIQGDPDRQMNELYVQKFEKQAKYWREQMLSFENQLNGVSRDGAEWRSIMEKLVEARDLAQQFAGEAKARQTEIERNER